MAVLQDGSSRYLPADIAARPWLGLGDDRMKILHVDEGMGQVVFLQRFGRDTTHLKHTHHCTAVAFTLSGCWAYDGDKFPTGTLAFEPYGSTHTAMTTDGDAAEVLVVITAGPGNPRLLELLSPDGRRLELDVAAFARLVKMSEDEDFAAFVSGLRETPAARLPPHL